MIYRLKSSLTRTDSLQGIALICTAACLFSVMDGMVKWLSTGYTPYQILFFRGLFGLIPAYYIIRRGGGMKSLKTKQPEIHFIRCFIAMVGSMGFCLGARTLPMANLYAIEFMSPLMMVLLCIFLLKEKVEIHRIIAALVGFLGILIVVRPGFDAFQIGSLYAIGGRMCFSVASILIKRLSTTDTKNAVAVYYLLMCIVFNAFILPFVWVTPTYFELCLLIGIGVIGGIAHICLTFAFYVAPVAVVAPFEYTALLWATLTGFIVWGEIPDKYVMIGSAIVSVAGLYVVHRERLAAKQLKNKTA
jgi:drug/metabolite transporter (DMT)-like permease